MKIGFLNNQVDNRGTGNALFDYADYNERILGNKSVVLSLDKSFRDTLMEKRLVERFGGVYTFPEFDIDFGLDVLYHIKSGENDGYAGAVNPKRTRYIVHAVFNGSQPHGDRYAAISSWLGKRFGIPFVPHIVDLPDTNKNLRPVLGIPESDVVFGRHGGPDSFDIEFVWRAINRVLELRSDIWFIFLNTNKPSIELFDPARVIFLDPVGTALEKRIFINTCNAMLHARGRGETFGLAVGEFSICGKPIITYSHSSEKAHLEELPLAYLYSNEDWLVKSLTDGWAKNHIETHLRGYTKYTPENVMGQFKEVFLD